MKTKYAIILSFLLLTMSNCYKEDISTLYSRQHELEERLKVLEATVIDINTEITVIRNILNTGDYILSVENLSDGSGIKITFFKAGVKIIKNGTSPKIGENGNWWIDGVDTGVKARGKDALTPTIGTNGNWWIDNKDTGVKAQGKDGITPVIGVAKDSNNPADKNYYWTQKTGTEPATFILDSNGKKIRANGIDGQPEQEGQPGQDGYAGETPVVSIDMDTDGEYYWKVKPDSSSPAEWMLDQNRQKIPARGPKGDSFFKSADTSNPDYVIFTLIDNSTFKVTIYKELFINFTDVLNNPITTSVELDFGTTVVVKYICTPNSDVVLVNKPDGWRASITTMNKTAGTGEVTIIAPANGTGSNEPVGEVVLMVTNSKNIAIPGIIKVTGKQKVYKIEIPVAWQNITETSVFDAFAGTRVYIVYDPEDTEINQALKRRLAEIDLEYIIGYDGSTEKPAVVVYEMDYASNPKGMRKNTGIIAANGKPVDWSQVSGTNYSGVYNPSASSVTTAFTEFYYIPGVGIQYTDPGVATTSLAPIAYSFKDWEGNEYPVGKIGLQYYMLKGLKAKTYNDNTAIPTNMTRDQWIGTTEGACCIYDYQDANDNTPTALSKLDTYGMLYNWYAGFSGKLDYNDWTVPTESQFKTLLDYAAPEGYVSSVPGRLKAKGTTYWDSNIGVVSYVSNITGFTGLGSGYRDEYNSSTGFGRERELGALWAKTNATTSSILRFSYSSVNPKIIDAWDKTDGHAVRLVTTQLFDMIP
jgi:uncharacterized protein (TIGR02145 family)